MITKSPPTRRLTECAQMSYTRGNVFPLTSNHRHHFRHRFHGLQDRVFKRLHKPEEFLQATGRHREEPNQRSGVDRPPDGTAAERNTGWRSKYDPRARPCAAPSARGRSSGSGHPAGSRADDLSFPESKAALRNNSTPRGFRCEEVSFL